MGLRFGELNAAAPVLVGDVELGPTGEEVAFVALELSVARDLAAQSDVLALVIDRGLDRVEAVAERCAPVWLGGDHLLPTVTRAHPGARPDWAPAPDVGPTPP